MKLSIIGIFVLTLFGCAKNDLDIQLNIDTKLPKDSNGYSYFTLYSQTTQNIHTISGSITMGGLIPDNPRQKVDWESSHSWILTKGESIGTIYRRTWRGLGWVIVDSIKVTNLKDSGVPTINPVCYNSIDGTINTVIAPIWEMKGDTMVIVARSGKIVNISKIILK
jgi:hypothetical protein